MVPMTLLKTVCAGETASRLYLTSSSSRIRTGVSFGKRSRISAASGAFPGSSTALPCCIPPGHPADTRISPQRAVSNQLRGGAYRRLVPAFSPSNPTTVTDFGRPAAGKQVGLPSVTSPMFLARCQRSDEACVLPPPKPSAHRLSSRPPSGFDRRSKMSRMTSHSAPAGACSGRNSARILVDRRRRSLHDVTEVRREDGSCDRPAERPSEASQF